MRKPQDRQTTATTPPASDPSVDDEPVVRRAPLPRPIGAEICNAIVTNAPLTGDELTTLLAHFRALADTCAISGPRFSNARRDAIDMHNRIIRRIRGEREEAARRAALDVEDPLLEIQG